MHKLTVRSPQIPCCVFQKPCEALCEFLRPPPVRGLVHCSTDGIRRWRGSWTRYSSPSSWNGKTDRNARRLMDLDTFSLDLNANRGTSSGHLNIADERSQQSWWQTFWCQRLQLVRRWTQLHTSKPGLLWLSKLSVIAIATHHWLQSYEWANANTIRPYRTSQSRLFRQLRTVHIPC